MKTSRSGAILFSVATWAGLALAAAPAPAASSAAPDGYATLAKSIGKKNADAQAQEDQRMAKCKAMKGDEKKGCEAHARSVAHEARKGGASSVSEGAPKR